MCTGDANCWCNKLVVRLPFGDAKVCLTPKQILDEYREQLDDADIQLLSSMTNHHGCFEEILKQSVG